MNKETLNSKLLSTNWTVVIYLIASSAVVLVFDFVAFTYPNFVEVQKTFRIITRIWVFVLTLRYLRMSKTMVFSSTVISILILMLFGGYYTAITCALLLGWTSFKSHTSGKKLKETFR